MKITKTIGFTLIGFAVIIVLGSLYSRQVNNSTILGSRPDLDRDQSQTATSSAEFMLSSTASSSVESIGMGTVPEINVNVLLGSTSTPKTITACYYTSFDETPSERDWYFKSCDSFTLATTSTSNINTRNFVVSNLVGNNFKVDWKVSGDSTSYVEIIKRKDQY